MSIAAYFLIIIVHGSKGVSVERVPMETMELCEAAGAQVRSLERTFSVYQTTCVKAAS